MSRKPAGLMMLSRVRNCFFINEGATPSKGSAAPRKMGEFCLKWLMMGR